MIRTPETPFGAVGPGEVPTNAMRESRESGFTLIELMTVIAIIGILVGVALPQYKNAILSAKEAVLVEDLHTMRSAIEQFRADKGTWPASLDDLVDKGYLKQKPKDKVHPDVDWVTLASTECEPQSPEAGASAPPTTAETGICDVRSGGEGPSLNFGKDYKDL
jgi:general secretion pathway protein G